MRGACQMGCMRWQMHGHLDTPRPTKQEAPKQRLCRETLITAWPMLCLASSDTLRGGTCGEIGAAKLTGIPAK